MAVQGKREVAHWPGAMLPVGVVIALVVVFSVTSDAFLSFRNLTAVASQASILLLASDRRDVCHSHGQHRPFCRCHCASRWGRRGYRNKRPRLGPVRASHRHLIRDLAGSSKRNGIRYRANSFVRRDPGQPLVFSGIALNLLAGRALQYNSPPFDELAIGQLVPHFPNVALLAIILWALMVLVCFKTRFGRYMYVIGGGEAVARTSGVPVVRYKIYAFMVSGALAGIAGTLAVARVGAAGPTLGTDLLLNTLAAVVVGGTSLSGGVGGVHRTLLGVLIITILDDGLNLLGVNQYTQLVIKGLVVIAAVLVSQDRSKIMIVK